MEFKELIAARHSVRTFSDKAVDRSLLEEIVEEAGSAPSSRNSQSSRFLIVEEPSLLEALSEMRTSGSALLKDAAAAIVVMGDCTKTDLWLDNAAISATYVLLSAADKGLGACWVHVNGRLRDKSDASKGLAEDFVRVLLGVDGNLKPLCVIAVGYELSAA